MDSFGLDDYWRVGGEWIILISLDFGISDETNYYAILFQV